MSRENSCKKRKKKVIRWFFIIALIFLILPLIDAASPFIVATTNGCSITPVVRESLKVNQAFDFNFHVFNISNGVPLSSSSLSCYFHLYNQSGDHIFWKMISNDAISVHLIPNEWGIVLAGNNISTIGTYAYVIQCNSTVSGCADKGMITVTNSGYDATTGRALIDGTLILILIIFFVCTLWIFLTTDNLLGRVGMIGLGYLLLIAITFISWNMANDFLLSAPFLAKMFRILFIVLMVGLLPLIIGGFVWYFRMLFRIKEIESLMTKGYSMDEAERKVKGRRKHG